MIDGFAPQAHSESLPYYQWKSTDNQIEKIVATDTDDSIFNELKKQLNTLILYTFVKRERAATFNSLKSSSDGISIVLQVDFSENATIVAQKEVQSAHWHHPEATLFTAHAWINNDNNFSMVIISDDLNHTKYCILVYMQCIFRSLRAKFPSIQAINIFSDGPSSQLKQRFFFSNLHHWEQDHVITIRWNFFATSHGKGVVDGIGGMVKRTVWRHIRSERSHVTTPHDYAALAKQLCSNVQIEFVAKSEIDQQFAFVDAKWEGVIAVPQTHRVHCIQTSGADQVKVADTSNEIDKCFRICRICKTIITPPTQSATGEDSPLDDDIQPCQLPPNLTIGLWVIIKYADEEYPEEETSIEDSDIEVSVMHKSVNAWKWSRPEHQIFYPTTQIVRGIDPPTVACNRGQFAFENI